MSNIITNEYLLKHVNTDHAIYYVKEIFKNCVDVDPAWMVEVRKIGQYRMQDDTLQQAEQSSAAQLLQFDQYDWIPGLANWVAQQCLRVAPVGIGTFMAPALLNDRRANDQSVQLLTTVCADFDTGFPQRALEELIKRIGVRPTFICHSGGITKDNQPKLHAHWRLDEPCNEPWKVAYIREQLALGFGADTSFKRIPQIIRIPGALYDKQGQWGTTIITEYNNHDVGLMQWEEVLGVDWNNLAEGSIHNKIAKKRTKEERQERLHILHTEEVTEGRAVDTRWDRFSEYAGHQIRQARFQHQTVEEALTSTKIWVEDKMVPAWADDRIEAEFKALLQRDRITHEDVWSDHGKPPITFGNAPTLGGAPVALPNRPTTAPIIQSDGMPEPQMWSIRTFGSKKLYAPGEAPAERHLIENFLVHGSSVALVADGGVGKTYISLELGLRAAAGPSLPNNRFLGFDVLEKMNVIIFTVEDSQADLHRRLDAIDSSGDLRNMADDACCIIPVQEQIMDGLTLAEKDGKGNFGPSKAWKAMQGYIQAYLDEMRPINTRDLPLLVIIDTYSATHHGDENSATGTNEWFRAAGLLRKFEATLMVTHHVRKADPKQEIRTASDMKGAVRGSSAFLNSLRTVYGIWEMPNGDAVLKEMSREEKGTRLFNAGILKNNTGIDWHDRSDPRYPDPMITLRRLGTGRLIYDDVIHQKRIELTAGKGERMAAARAQLRAAIIHAVRWYAENGWPLSERNLTKDKEQFLPPRIRDMSRDAEIKPMLNSLIGDGTLKQITMRGKGGGVIFDVPEGAYFIGTQTQRRSDNPAMQWSRFRYDSELEEYVEIENSQAIMDL